jgi:manganese/iron transport system permease protein
LDLSIFGYQFMQNAMLAAFLGGIACAVIGVFVVLLHMSFIGVAMSHAAFAGALLGLLIGVNPLITAFAFSLLAALVIGPLAHRGELNPEASLGVIFSLMLGLAFLFMGLNPSTKSSALELLWGSILTVTHSNVILLAVVAVIVVGLVIAFFKEFKPPCLIAILPSQWVCRQLRFSTAYCFSPAPRLRHHLAPLADYSSSA